MARSTSLSSASFVSLVRAAFEQIDCDVELFSEKLSEVLPVVIREINAEKLLAEVSTIRLQALCVEFYRKNKNVGTPTEVLKPFLTKAYLKTYEGGDIDKLEMVGNSVDSFIAANMASKKGDKAILNGTKVGVTTDNAFLVSNGPAGTSLRDFESLWKYDSSEDYQELMSALAAVNNPVVEQDDEADSEADSDSEAETSAELNA